jgi:GntR family transcriptional regulator, trigonelline degradation regulator
MSVRDTALRVAPVAAPLRAQVVRNLREAILNRTFEPGERLRERELTELTGVSRTVVREALRQLESEGLVVLIPNVGPVVARITALEANDLYEVRAVLEALAARRFATEADEAEIDELVATVDAIERVAKSGEIGELLACKEAFYGVLLRGASNAVLSAQLGSLRARIGYLRATSFQRPERSSETVAELRALLAAIRRRDPDAAAELSRKHVEKAAEAALPLLQES